MKSYLGTGLLLLSLLSTLHAEGLRTIPVGPNPESVTRGFGGHYYASLMGETRTPGDGNGRIVMVEGDSVKVFADGLDDPKGIVFTGEFLVTADFTKLWKIDAAGRKTLLAGPEAFPQPPVYLNDVALAPDGRSVLVTDMGAAAKMRGPDGQLWALDSAEAKALPAIGRIYRVTLDGKVSEVIAPRADMACPNGVEERSGGRIYVAEFFTGKIFEWQPGQWRQVAEGHRSVDGVVHDAAGNLYVSEVFTGKVWRYPAAGGAPELLLPALAAAADIFLDEAAKVLVIPNTKAGTLVVVPVK